MKCPECLNSLALYTDFKTHYKESCPWCGWDSGKMEMTKEVKTMSPDYDPEWQQRKGRKA